MQNIIINKLKNIASKEGIRILYACESGSRGWQCHSHDSDYDVRFIFARPFTEYLCITERNDQIDFPISDDLDIFGWDIRKVLKLIKKSNTTPFEWLQSPIVYMQQAEFKDDLWDLCAQYFDSRSNILHYLGIARSALETIVNNDQITVKKLFYVLRSLLAAKWCIEKKSIAPMTIHQLICLLPENLQTITENLLLLKSGVPESYIIQFEPELKQFIDSEYETCKLISADMQKTVSDAAPLDTFFRQIISQQ